MTTEILGIDEKFRDRYFEWKAKEIYRRIFVAECMRNLLKDIFSGVHEKFIEGYF